MQNKYVNFKFLLKILISLFLIYFLFSKIEWQQAIDIIKNINIAYFLLCLFVVFVSIVLNTKKWQILLSHINIHKRVRGLLKLNLASLFYTMVLPGGQLAGESIKCYQITRDSSEKGKLVFSVLLDRITGFVGLIIVGGLGILFSNSHVEYHSDIMIIFGILFLFSLLFLLLFNNKTLSFFKSIVDSIIKGQDSIVRKIVNKLIEMFALYGGAYKLIFVTLVYGTFYQILNTLHVYLLAKSIGLTVAIWDVGWIMALVSIVLLIPITVMGLGLREGGFVVFLGLIGVTAVESLSLSMLVSFVFALTAIAGGLVEFRNHFLSKKSLS